MLDALLLLSTAAFIAAGAAVGARLLLLAARTRELSDFLVGFALFDLAAVAYPLILYGSFGELSLGGAKLVSALATTSMALGWGSALAFTQRVFRSGVGWAIGLAGGIAALLAYGAAAAIAHSQGAADRAALATPALRVVWMQVAAVAIYGWSGAEGFRCWSQARRRMRLGLADPLIVNRFLLWGWVCVGSLLSIAPALALTLAGENAIASRVPRLCTGVAGVAVSVALQLAFLPPPAYRAWIARRAAA